MSGWGIAPIIGWRKIGFLKVKAPGLTTNLPKHTSAMLPETVRLTKRCEIGKGVLFDLIPTGIIHVIDMWLVVIKICNNLNEFMM